jgi:PKD repeat protein
MGIFRSVFYLFAPIVIGLSGIMAQAGSHPSVSPAGSFNSEHVAGDPLRGNGMMFAQNKGQLIDMTQHLRPDILFKGEGGGADVYLRKTGITYVLSNEKKVLHEIDESVEERQHSGKITVQQAKKLKQELEQNAFIKLHRIDVDFLNGNPNAKIVEADQVEGITNYYYSHCPDGITQVKSFNEITVKNIYDNIDVNYYGGKVQGVKYDIVVNPGGDPGLIKLKYSGANIKLESLPTGQAGSKLKVESSLGTIIEYMPKVYQNINGKIVDVKSVYILNETTVTFELGSWNHSFPLVIDPWASYYSGDYGELGFSVTTDPSGNVAFTGQARSDNLPTSAGSFQTTVGAAGRNVFAVKMTSTGGRVWGTYYGSTGTQAAGWGIASDAAGNILVSVSGVPNTLPVGATAGNVVQQPAGVGGALIKFDPLLGTRIWATFYGGNSSYGNDVVTDGSNVYLYGTTASTTNISTAGTFQTALNGASDVFVAKFASNGALVWGTYIGGSGDEATGGVAYNAISGNVCLGGYTTSNNFPATLHQTIYGGGTDDAFLFTLSPAGTQVWSTYYGGANPDFGNVIVTDGIGNVIIGGSTGSTNNIASGGAYQPANGGGAGGYGTNDVFLAKFNSAGVRQWGTYFGGTQWELINGLDVDATNKIYISGEFEDNNAGNYPISACAYQPAFGGSEDAYIARYDPNGKQLCITYLGGPLHDEAAFDNGYSTGGGSLAVYGNNLHLIGCTEGSYPVTAGAFQTAFGGAEPGFAEFNEAYITQLCINICEGMPDLNFTAAPNSVCANAPVTFTPSVSKVCDTSGYKFQWTFAGGSPSSSTAINPTVTFAGTGNHPVKLVLTTACKKDSLTQMVVVNSSCVIKASATGATICQNSCANITANGTNGTAPYAYSWNTGATTQTINVCPLTNTNYLVTITDALGNTATAPTSVIIHPVINTTPSSVNINCTTPGSASIAVNSATVPYVYSWSNGSTGTSIQNIAAGNYTVTVTDGNGCTKTDTYNITSTSPASAAFTFPPVCMGALTTFTNTGSTGTYYWQIDPTSPTVSGTTVDFSYTFLTAGSYTITHNVTTGGCTASVISTINVINCSAPSITAVGNSACPGSCATVTSAGAGGTGAYTYSWSTGATSQNISACPATTTTYTVKVTDAGGATATTTATVAINPAVNVTATPLLNCGTNSGSITATVTSGSSSFTYSWSNGVTTTTSGTSSQISGLTSNTYSVTVTDSKGCSASASAIIDPPFAAQYIKGTANCAGCGCKEWVMVTPSNGRAPYTYDWPALGGYDKRYLNKICPGIYTISVTDKNGCNVNVTVNTP